MISYDTAELCLKQLTVSKQTPTSSVLNDFIDPYLLIPYNWQWASAAEMKSNTSVLTQVPAVATLWEQRKLTRPKSASPGDPVVLVHPAGREQPVADGIKVLPSPELSEWPREVGNPNPDKAKAEKTEQELLSKPVAPSRSIPKKSP